MNKTTKARGRGRPPLDKRMTQASIRLDDDLVDALNTYKQANGLDDLSTAVRHALRMFFREKGLLK